MYCRTVISATSCSASDPAMDGVGIANGAGPSVGGPSVAGLSVGGPLVGGPLVGDKWNFHRRTAPEQHTSTSVHKPLIIDRNRYMPSFRGWARAACAGLLFAFQCVSLSPWCVAQSEVSAPTLANAPTLASAEDPSTSTVSRLSADAMFLASDDLAGRDVGSPGIAQAGEYIAHRFQELGLVTDSFNGGPYQEFTIPGPAALGPREQNRLQFEGSHSSNQLELGQQFTPVSLGSSGSFAGDVVFVGYGISAPELNYDDYANVDVRGKVVIALRKEPGQNDPTSRFDGAGPSQYAFFSTKELNAALHGAAALILVNDQVTVARAGSDELPALTAAGSAVSEPQIPTIYCLRAAIDPLLQQSLGKSLRDVEDAIELAQTPQSYLLQGIRAQGETLIAQSQTPVRNVFGLLPGNGELADQYVVIGAHYDHVGMGGSGSLAPGTVAIHNGADDNASGTAVLLETARRLSTELSPGNPATVGHSAGRRSIIFVAFTAEERGLLGSKHYVRNPRWPLEQTVAMLNMDMVGRMEGNSLTVYGTGTAAQFSGIIDRVAAPLGLSINKQPAGFGPSDHASFYEVNIPVLHFFTGLHNDYHRPSDVVEKLNIPAMATIAEVVTDIAAELASVRERPTLLQTTAVAQIGRAAKPKRAVLGVKLDTGRRIPTVTEVAYGSAAATGGVRSGDIITAIDQQETASYEELQRILANRSVGQSVNLSVLRGTQHLQLTVTLQEG